MSFKAFIAEAKTQEQQYKRSSLEFQQLAADAGWELELWKSNEVGIYHVTAKKNKASAEFELNFSKDTISYISRELSDVVRIGNVHRMESHDIDSIFNQAFMADELARALKMEIVGVKITYRLYYDTTRMVTIQTLVSKGNRVSIAVIEALTDTTFVCYVRSAGTVKSSAVSAKDAAKFVSTNAEESV